MDYYDDYGFRPYIPVAARRAQAARALAKLQKKGRTLAPVAIEGRKIARTFWGKAWCDNLERYSDYANRLPRGRTYVRNGSVIDLQVASGRVTALVSGSTMYEVTVLVGALPRARWNAICADCSEAIDSLVELLQGRFSKGVMTRICEEKTGLFPSPKDIQFTCSCPDWASMCKHVAAVLYGIGARLDQQPELLFALRAINKDDLVASAGRHLSKAPKRPAGSRVLAVDDLSEMFGIDMAPPDPPAQSPAPATQARSRTIAAPPTARSRRATSKKPATPELPLEQRQRLSERMRAYWAERRAKTRTR